MSDLSYDYLAGRISHLDLVEAWRHENKDDSANHDFIPQDDRSAFCQDCGDNEAGLLHAFDESYPSDYFDEPILDAYLSDDEDWTDAEWRRDQAERSGNSSANW